MFDINDFKTINLTSGFPSISITKNGITFNKAAIMKLDEVGFVNLLFDEDDKVLAVKACKKEDDKAIAFLRAGKKVLSVRWNFKDFLQTLESLMNWKLEDQGYRVKGLFDRDQMVLFFDLKTASFLEDKGGDD